MQAPVPDSHKVFADSHCIPVLLSARNLMNAQAIHLHSVPECPGITVQIIALRITEDGTTAPDVMTALSHRLGQISPLLEYTLSRPDNAPWLFNSHLQTLNLCGPVSAWLIDPTQTSNAHIAKLADNPQTLASLQTTVSTIHTLLQTAPSNALFALDTPSSQHRGAAFRPAHAQTLACPVLLEQRTTATAEHESAFLPAPDRARVCPDPYKVSAAALVGHVWVVMDRRAPGGSAAEEEESVESEK